MYSQSASFKITGIIQTEKDKSPLESATIHLEIIKDSTVVSYTISNDKGYFSLEGKSFQKELRLYVSYIGLKTYSKKITINNKSLNLGAIIMKSQDNMLDEVVIKSRAPITIKKDTLEFNVKSFKTKKDASVEDLLKKLPGVEVDEQGKITVNGKPVNKILVNGKPFFGDDPTIATKNLTKEIIEKVQITDTKTKSEAFTGQKGDQNNKTINLTIKKENNKGWFGRLAAGKGTNDHYEYAAIINRFDNDRRFSVLLGGNNINSPGFSFGEIQKMFGSGGNTSISVSSSGGMNFSIGGRSFGTGEGIVKSKNSGFTYADQLSKKIEINADYFHSGSNSNNESKSNRENILSTGNYFSNSNTTSNNDYASHSFNTEIDIKVDSTFMINIKPAFTLNKNEGFNTNYEETLDENKQLKNKSTSNNSSKSTVNQFKNKISFSKKFGKKGAFVGLTINNQIDKTDGKNYNSSETEIINSNTIKRNQLRDNKSEYSNIDSRLTYRKPLIAKKLFLDFAYQYSTNKREDIKSTYDFDTTTQDHSNFNTLLSTDFTYKSTKSSPSLQISFREKKWSLSLKGGYVNRNIESEDKLRPNLNLNRNFNNIEARSSFSYSFDSRARLYTSYSVSNSIPSVSQIQPFVNENNPLNIITGNPNLKPTNNHRYSLSFNKFNFQAGTGFFIYANINSSENNIATKTTIDPVSLIRNTTYENVNGNYNLGLSGNYNKKFKLDSLNTLTVRVGSYISANKNVFFFNGIKSNSSTKSISPSLGLTLELKNIIQIFPRYSASFSRTIFAATNQEEQNYVSHNLSINTKTLSNKKLEWQNNIRYNYNPNVAVGFDKSAWFWNSSLSYSVLKDKGTISLKVYDLLNQNTNARRTVTSNYIEDKQSTVLQQYFMLGFSWKFNSLGKKGKTRDFGEMIIF
jgi:hypothetical protein